MQKLQNVHSSGKMTVFGTFGSHVAPKIGWKSIKDQPKIHPKRRSVRHPWKVSDFIVVFVYSRLRRCAANKPHTISKRHFPLFGAQQNKDMLKCLLRESVTDKTELQERLGVVLVHMEGWQQDPDDKEVLLQRNDTLRRYGLARANASTWATLQWPRLTEP